VKSQAMAALFVFLPWLNTFKDLTVHSQRVYFAPLKRMTAIIAALYADKTTKNT